MYTRTLVLATIMLVIACGTAHAEVRRICAVTYDTEDGESDVYKLEVSFVTGKELNRSTHSYNYSSWSNYALVWFAKGKVAILQLGVTLLGVGDEFEDSNFKSMFLFASSVDAEQVNSPEPRSWHIKAKDYLNWIDPRVE